MIRWRVVAAATVAYGALLAWQQTHGGVVSHHLFAREDLPAISNWWGALSIPLATAFLTGRIQRRLSAVGTDTIDIDQAFWRAVAACTAAALYGAAMALGFLLGQPAVSTWLFQALPLVGLVLPIYRAEYLLGFVVALSLPFGGVLPLIIGGAIALLSLLLHLTIRRGVRWVLVRSRHPTTP